MSQCTSRKGPRANQAKLHAPVVPLRRAARAALGVLLSGGLVAGALAHETWLLPRSFIVAPGESAEMEMSSGMGFPDPGSGVDQTRIIEAVVLQHGERQSLVPSRALPGALELTAVPEAGLACAWVQVRPRVLEIEEADSVEHYLDEIGAPASVREAWAEGDGEWRESYGKVARTYLRAESPEQPSPPSSSACWATKTSARFDVLPMTDPTSLAAGDELQLQVFFDGAPLAGQAIGFVREGEAPRALTRSDSEGRLSLAIEGPGRHMIYATQLRPAEGDDYNWESDFITLTFEVAGD